MRKINDKTLHVYAGALIAITITFLFLFGTSINVGFIYTLALFSGILAGAFKEWVYDKTLKLGQFSYDDFYFTIWGSVIGTVFSIAVSQWMLIYHSSWFV